jgi:hypothetical protein
MKKMQNVQQLWVKICFSNSGKLQKGEKTDLKKKFLPAHVFLGSGIQDPQSEIRDGKKSGSGINIPDPQHWFRLCTVYTFFINNPDPKMYRFKKKTSFFIFSSCFFHQKSGSKNVLIFKKSIFWWCLNDLQIFSSDVFFIKNRIRKRIRIRN